MSALRLNIIVDLRPLINVIRYSEKNQPIITRVAAQRYLRYLRQRFYAQSAGGGGWEGLKEETIKRKERRGVAPNPNWILREFGELVKSFGIRNKGKWSHAPSSIGIGRSEGSWWRLSLRVIFLRVMGQSEIG